MRQLGEQVVELGDFPVALAERLGGTTKLVELLGTAPSPEEAIKAAVGTLPRAGKVTFGVSVYGPADAAALTSLAKRSLKERGIGSRFVPSSGTLSPAQVHHNKLIGKGHEWCLFATNDGWRYGRTVWIPDFEAFSARDYDKPVADAKRGMLPPQLSRVMINLGTQGRAITVFDPFCGVGALLLESVAMGHPTYGSDIDQAAVDGAGKNLRWLTGVDPETKPFWKVTVHDATQSLPLESPLTIVTEGYLGESIRQSSSEEDIRGQADSVSRITRQFFEQARKILSPGSRLVITLPIWRLSEPSGSREEPGSRIKSGMTIGRLRLEIIAPLAALGYTVIRPVPTELAFPGVTERGSLEVSRPKQRVIHELFIFERI